ncbi:MAG: DUF2442 domain-containing protein [Caldilineaceae bacterium]
MHEIFYVVDFKIVRPYTLRVRFDDDSEQVINFEPVLYGEMFGPLRDKALFEQVRLDAEIRNLVWPNDAAFDPETLRNWPRYKDEFAKMAQSWDAVVV